MEKFRVGGYEEDYGGLLKVRGVERIDKCVLILRNPEGFQRVVVELAMLYAANKLEQFQALILSFPRGSREDVKPL